MKNGSEKTESGTRRKPGARATMGARAVAPPKAKKRTRRSKPAANESLSAGPVGKLPRGAVSPQVVVGVPGIGDGHRLTDVAGCVLAFRVAGRPVSQGNHRITFRNGKRVLRETTKGHAAWRLAVRRAAARAADSAKLAKLTGGVILYVDFFFRRPPTHVKKKGGLRKGKPIHKISAPDLSKLIRAVEDSLTDAEVWTDDSLVVGVHATKRYSDDPEREGAEFALFEAPE